MEGAHRQSNEVGGAVLSWIDVAGCNISEIEMNWIGGLDRAVDNFVMMIGLEGVSLNMEMMGVRQMLHPRHMSENEDEDEDEESIAPYNEK